MGLKIIDRNYSTRNHGAGNAFPLFNIGQMITEVITFTVDFDFKSSTAQQALILSEYSIRILGADVTKLGWVVGDTVALTGSLDPGTGPTWSASAASFTIAELEGDVITFTSTLNPFSFPGFEGQVMPMSAGGAVNSPLLIASARTAPEELEIFHNFVENSSPASKYSLFDGEANRFVATDVDAMAVSDSLAMEQLGNKSGGSYIYSAVERLADTGGLKTYAATFIYFAPYQFLDADFSTPDCYEASKAVKPSYFINAYPVANNPNSYMELKSASLLGNTGYFGENYNQGPNDFEITSVSLTVGAGTPVSALDFNQVTHVEATIISPADFEDFAEIQFNLIPALESVKNQPESQHELISLSNCYVEVAPSVNASVAYGIDGAELAIDNAALTVGTGEITISFDLTPTAEFTALLESMNSDERRYRLAVTVENVGGTENVNTSTTLILSEGLMEAAPVIGGVYPNVTFNGFFNHSQDLTGVSEIIYNGCTEDDFLYVSRFNLKNNAAWSRLDLSVRLVRDSDGQYFDLLSRSVPFSPYVTDVDGVIHIDYSEPLNQLLDSPDRNKLEVKNTGTGTNIDYEVQIIWSLMASWRYWIAQNDALLDFFNTALPQNGRSNEWMRYLREAGYSIKVRATLVNASDVAYYWGSGLNLQDYDDAGDISTTFEYYDGDGNPQSALVAGQLMTVKAIHTATGFWDPGNVWGWIGLRPYESETMRRISTAWDWTSQNAPLKPNTGESRAVISYPSPNVAVIECVIDTTLLGVENYTVVSRIESPIYPACISPVDYLFQAVLAASDFEADLPVVLDKFLDNGLDVTHANVCCGDCEQTFKTPAAPIYNLYAFGTAAQMSAMQAYFVEPYCCADAYGVASACTADFDADFDAFTAGITGDVAALEALVPSQVNTFTASEFTRIASWINDLTADPAIRYDMLAVLLDRGLLCYCREDGYKQIKKIAL